MVALIEGGAHIDEIDLKFRQLPASPPPPLSLSLYLRNSTCRRLMSLLDSKLCTFLSDTSEFLAYSSLVALPASSTLRYALKDSSRMPRGLWSLASVLLQRNLKAQWIREIQHPSIDLLRVRHHKSPASSGIKFSGGRL